ncbi:FMN-dependent NADH-azoreductase [Paraburkholderia silviterrae]|uniref:FMN dependent NADH:quinone oxidoreductase n=1 Tax=Paraburkholderia silviterrae TaxID=2528715 RepID=A0A4R5M9L8_9BURK|nr:NAD(P)H-dependent oxidoreductase [Paraburkholderia silviterrae]TDG23303.1 FMN-dependent NADH-azoreductase [Paraburkholderia silviterrae]
MTSILQFLRDIVRPSPQKAAVTTILQINSAARSQGAQSTLLVNELTDKLRNSKPGAKVLKRNLQADPLPHLDDAVLGAFFTPAEQRTPEQQAIAARSEALIAELQVADIIVIGAPMYNFGISSQLKTYFDWIARAGITFQYTANGPEGLVKGKKVFVVSARGGVYQGTPNDSQTPYLTSFLGFLGMTDVNFIYAEGLNMGPEAASAALASARETIAAAA